MGYWTPLAKARIRELKKSWGTGWGKLGPDLREALIAREVVSVLVANATAHEALTSMREMAEEFYTVGGTFDA